MADAKEIAEGLTEAQRRAVLRGTCSSRTLEVFFRKAMAIASYNTGDYPHYPERPKWTPLGLAVRTHLREG
jgi:hypothetical protein